MSYTIELIPTKEYDAREIAEIAYKNLIETYGVLEDTVEEAIAFAKDRLPADELGVYYTIEAVEFCE